MALGSIINLWSVRGEFTQRKKITKETKSLPSSFQKGQWFLFPRGSWISHQKGAAEQAAPPE